MPRFVLHALDLKPLDGQEHLRVAIVLDAQHWPLSAIHNLRLQEEDWQLIRELRRVLDAYRQARAAAAESDSQDDDDDDDDEYEPPNNEWQT